jgi:hypothetical protein
MGWGRKGPFGKSESPRLKTLSIGQLDAVTQLVITVYLHECNQESILNMKSLKNKHTIPSKKLSNVLPIIGI